MLIAAAFGRPAHRAGFSPTPAMIAGAGLAFVIWEQWDGWWRLVAPALVILVFLSLVRRRLDRERTESSMPPLAPTV